MAANGASDDDSTIKVAPKKPKDKATGVIKLKKPAPKHSDPGNWQEGRVIDEEKKSTKGTDTPSNNSMDSPGPVVNQLDDNARATFATGRPLEDALELQVCKHCKKSVLKTAMKAHLIPCLKAKKEKAQRKKEQKEARERERRGLAAEGDKEKDDEGDTRMDEDDEEEGGVKGAKKSAGKKAEGGKKRKAEGDAEKGPKQKKKKEEPKPKAPKTRGPVDVERQCGVLKDGVPCARSLTCKSHSMGAKRAVPGRSLPYDMLLSQYQKKNQAKQQKAALSANAPLEDEDASLGPIDSDEELSAIQAGLSHWNPQPLVPPPVHIPILLKYQNARLYEQLAQATNNFTVNICKVVGWDGKTANNPPPPTAAGVNGAGVGNGNGYASHSRGQGQTSYGGNGNGNTPIETLRYNNNLEDRDAEGEAETPLLNGGSGAGQGTGLGIGGGVSGGATGQHMASVAARRASGFNMQMPTQRREGGGQGQGGRL